MTYLLPTNSAEANFKLMNQNIWTTEEALREDWRFQTEKVFPQRIRDDVIKIIVFVALSILSHLVWYTGRLDTTLYIASMTFCMAAVIYDTIKLKNNFKKRADNQIELAKILATVNTIYNQVTTFIDEKRQAKANYIEKRILDVKAYNNNNFPTQFATLSVAYYQKNPDQLPFKEAIKSIRARRLIPNVPKEVSEQFKDACDEYATCHLLYETLAKKYQITAPSTLN